MEWIYRNKDCASSPFNFYLNDFNWKVLLDIASYQVCAILKYYCDDRNILFYSHQGRI